MTANKIGESIPEIMIRGGIDLVFREKDGWVVVDYKTDDREGRDIAELVKHYRPQLLAYAEAWEKITGERVSETGLYFTNTDKYMPEPYEKNNL